ncbi:MAG: branched-chain amino acid transport system II carrier protein, partial [Oscillospiraceae bacterium]
VGPHIPSVLKEGIMAGYQTMDMLGTIIISVAVLSSITQKGYNSQKSQFKMIGFSGLVSAIALFAVYCGLSFLGASVSTVFEAHLTQAELLIAITKGVLGHEGVILLGIIVAFACLTTAIGLVSSASAYFANVSKGKLSYKHLVIAISAFSCIISNLGISKIIEFAAPILSLLYPILVVLTVMALFSNKIKNNNIYRGAALGALVTSIVALTENIFKLNLGIKYLPFNSFGFEWILPAIIGGIIGVFIKEKHSLQSN